MSAFNDLLAQGLCEPQQALDLFDSLEPVALDAMIGQWRGAGFHTNHPMDRDIPGLLTSAGFTLDTLEQQYLPGPKMMTYNYWGVASA